jgi:hypothetical protein
MEEESTYLIVYGADSDLWMCTAKNVPDALRQFDEAGIDGEATAIFRCYEMAMLRGGSIAMARKNPNAYPVSPIASTMKLEVVVMLDPVPGAWHDPEDFFRWLFQHTYVQSVELIDGTIGRRLPGEVS